MVRPHGGRRRYEPRSVARLVWHLIPLLRRSRRVPSGSGGPDGGWNCTRMLAEGWAIMANCTLSSGYAPCVFGSPALLIFLLVGRGPGASWVICSLPPGPRSRSCGPLFLVCPATALSVPFSISHIAGLSFYAPPRPWVCLLVDRPEFRIGFVCADGPRVVLVAEDISARPSLADRQHCARPTPTTAVYSSKPRLFLWIGSHAQVSAGRRELVHCRLSRLFTTCRIGSTDMLYK